MSEISKSYDLEERTARFGESIVSLCRSLGSDPISRRLTDQLIRSGTSIGANYIEANAASSKRDFRNKIYLSRKEAQETKYWLRMVSSSVPTNDMLNKIAQECQELILIFNKITYTLKENEKLSFK